MSDILEGCVCGGGGGGVGEGEGWMEMLLGILTCVISCKKKLRGGDSAPGCTCSAINSLTIKPMFLYVVRVDLFGMSAKITEKKHMCCSEVNSNTRNYF